MIAIMVGITLVGVLIVSMAQPGSIINEGTNSRRTQKNRCRNSLILLHSLPGHGRLGTAWVVFRAVKGADHQGYQQWRYPSQMAEQTGDDWVADTLQLTAR